MKFKKNIWSIFLYLLLGFIPTFNLIFKLKLSPTGTIINLINNLVILFFCLNLIKFTKKLNSFTTFIVISLVSIYYWLISFLILYWNYTNNIFNLYFYLDSFNDIKETSAQIFKTNQIIFFSLFLIILAIFYFISFKRYANRTTSPSHFLRSFFISLTLVIIFFITNSQSFDYLGNQYNSIANAKNIRKEKLIEFPNNEIYQTSSQDNIFILQLESGNGMILNGDLPNLNETYYPYIKKIAKKGVLFPYFWGNSVQTNRAQENILCGIYSNHNESYSYNPDKITIDCLPEILHKHGYTTIYFRSSDLSYTNLGNFARKIGFQEIHYSDIMDPNDQKYGWGYDDCVFYQRAFKYLRENYPNQNKLLVYFEVSSHHYPFNPKEKYNFSRQFDDDENFQKRYLDSWLNQDYCVSQFYNDYQSYSQNNDSHLFILPDTSWPVGTHRNIFNEKNSYNDNFMTFLTYLPPERKRSEFKIGYKVEKIHSQTDLIPTIFELLNKENYQNSFAFELINSYEKEYQYEDCHILTQPYGGTEIAIVKNSDKYIYNFQNNLVTHFDLKEDWLEKNPQIIEIENFDNFRKNYFCQRF
jgi:hypothetical protein